MRLGWLVWLVWLVFLMLQVWLVPPTSFLRLLRSDASAPPGAEPSRRPGPETRVQCHSVDPVLEGGSRDLTPCGETPPVQPYVRDGFGIIPPLLPIRLEAPLQHRDAAPRPKWR